ncbi:MAG: RNA polymerase sigma factor, partial [Planctomycetota bacterium]
MSDTMTVDDMRTVLQRDDWLRRVARTLFRDENRADEAVQEAWTAALLKAKDGAVPRSWLRGVLRNVRRDGARSRARHATFTDDIKRRGEAVAPATSDVVADLQLRETAARALLDLEEPLRTTLYLRFVSDLSVTEVAKRMGVAQSTASERLARGLDALRTFLDEGYDGGRREWLGVLAPLALPGYREAAGVGSSAAGGSASGVGSKLALVVGIAAAGWAGAALIGSNDSDSADDDAANVEIASVPQRGTQLSSQPDPPVRNTASNDPTTRGREFLTPTMQDGDEASAAEPSPVTTAPAAAAASESARFTGAFILPDGSPAAGARWQLRSQVFRGGKPPTPTVIEGILGADGQLDASIVPEESGMVFLRVSLPGHV